ncbi:uncharacterized protein LOC143889423 [Tasmannia lanceolata]|uniref:uncharacterized protein LOC143889423 n=1 Tax=Tasmannia lanceolata TaxID=3420 RepID=UPI004062EA71
MGDHEGWAQPSGILPNGLLPNEAIGVTRVLDAERWSRAEERTTELIACIQPNKPSEERRNAVADYVQRLIMKCFSCQVFTFGSVPLKTYLPDGDIDLTAFSKNQNLKDTWAQEVRDALENEEKCENAEFRVKEVQYIQAEVKIIKCLVENIVVDISFNQLGGLCTLCFLEEVDHLINQNHLFKRSIILIKAWCYYESRILGAHHGLISTYALETLVLYIFHVFNNSFTGPLEVLYRFLEFFSNFDWDNFCVSLWGPVPISSLPDMTAEPPRRDRGELLLNKLFLDACSSVYAVFPGGHENQGQPFLSKHFNVIDPLRTNNNLGRSVSKGNFFRIRSAFAFGAEKLARLLECPDDDLIAEVNQFFMNTWDRHGSGHRPDAPSRDLWPPRTLNPDPIDGSENFRNHPSTKKKSENIGLPALIFHGVSSQPLNTINQPHENMSRTNNVSTFSRTQSHKNYANQLNSRIYEQVARNIISNENTHAEKGQKSSRLDYLVNEHEGQGRYHFARTRSSPELTDTSSEILSQGRRNRVSETGKTQFASQRTDHISRKKNLSSEVSSSHSARSSAGDPSSSKHSPSHQSLEIGTELNSVSNSYHGDVGLGPMVEEHDSVTEMMEMQREQERQDLVNMMASSRVHNFNGQVDVPLNLGSAHLPIPMSPFLASMGYAQRNVAGMVPPNIPLIEPHWGSNAPFSQGLVSSQLSHYFPGVGLASNEEMFDSSNENSGLTELNQDESDGFWQEQDADSNRGFDSDNGNFQNSGGSFMRDQHKVVKENRGLLREDPSDTFQHQNKGNAVYSADGNTHLSFLPVQQASSSRSKPGSESSWEGSSTKSSKSTRDKRGRKIANSAFPPTGYGKAKSGWEYEGASSDLVSSLGDDDNKEWITLSNTGNDMAERSVGPITPMLMGSGSRQRAMDNNGVVPFAFYPTGPPVPFLTMLPVYNFPPETGNSDGSTTHFDRDDGPGNSRVNQCDQNFDLAESIDQSEIFTHSNSINCALPEPSDEHKLDILNSDFASHWQNLQYGRVCLNPRYHGPVVYPSPVVVPPVYLQGHFPWDGPGRPFSANMNPFTQLMGYGPRLVPMTPLQHGTNRPTGVYHRYGDEVPRYRGGTGTYLPNPKASFRDRQYSGTRNHRGNYNYNRNDHNDREGNWNNGSKSRVAGRNHGRNQAEKPSFRPDGHAGRQWDPHRHEIFASYQNGPLGPTNSLQSSSNSVHNSTPMAYGMYPLPGVNSNGVTPNGPGVPSVVMLYSYDHNGGYGSPSEQLEFGSLGPVQFSGINEVSQIGDGGLGRNVFEQRNTTYRVGSPTCSSPDQPSSPQLQRGI